MTRSRLFTALLVAALLTAGLLVARTYQQRAQHAERLRLEKATRAVPLFTPAPDVQLLDREGSPTPLSSYQGRVVLLNFWATWCGPCKAEMPSLIELQETLDPRDIAFVSIAEDDTWPPLDAYLKRTPLPFDVYRDRPPRIEIPFQTTSYPTTFLIDRDGRALYRFNGAMHWNTPEIRALIALEGVRTR